jgi:hypothetical protein
LIEEAMDRKFHCKRCKAELATRDGAQLIIGAVEFYGRTPLRCRICRTVTVWYPPSKCSMAEKPQNLDSIPALSVV